MRDTNFYDKESDSYSEKRYLGEINNFIKYFFSRRLELFIYFLKKQLSSSLRREGVKMLDIGCADGFVMAEAYRAASGRIGRAVGIDTSLEMIKKAKEKTSGEYPFDFFLRGEEGPENFDLIVELGVPISNLREEFGYVNSKLSEEGIFIFSTPGSKNSLYSKIKGDFHVADPMSFAQFDALVTEFFEIKESKHYAFFVPLLWRFPFMAKTIQPIFEATFSFITPFLFHEKIYLLQKRGPESKIGAGASVSSGRMRYISYWSNMERIKLLIRYLFSGGLAFGTNIIFLYIFAEYFHMWYLLASTLAFIVAFVVSFLSQKIITFQDKSKDRIPKQASLYLTLAIFNIFANGFLMLALVDIVSVHYLVSQVIASGFIAVWNLIIYRYVIFPKRYDL